MRPKTGHCHKAKYILIQGHCHKAKYILIHNSRTYELRFAKILIHKLFYFSAVLKNLYHKFLIFVRGRGEIFMIVSTFNYSNKREIIQDTRT
jgi:hypothetical protein